MPPLMDEAAAAAAAGCGLFAAQPESLLPAAAAGHAPFAVVGNASIANAALHTHHAKRKSIDDTQAALAAAAAAAATQFAPAAMPASPFARKKQRHNGPSNDFSATSVPLLLTPSSFSRKRSHEDTDAIIRPIVAQLDATHVSEMCLQPVASECKRAKVRHGAGFELEQPSWHLSRPLTDGAHHDEDECIANEIAAVSMCDSESSRSSAISSSATLMLPSSRASSPVSVGIEWANTPTRASSAASSTSFPSSAAASALVRTSSSAASSCASHSDTDESSSHAGPASLALENRRLRAMLLSERARRIRAEQQLRLLQQRMDLHEAKQYEPAPCYSMGDPRLIGAHAPPSLLASHHAAAAVTMVPSPPRTAPTLSPRILRSRGASSSAASVPRRSPRALRLRRVKREQEGSDGGSGSDEDDAGPALSPSTHLNNGVLDWHHRPAERYLAYCYPQGLPRCLIDHL